MINLPYDIYEKIINISCSISRFYERLDASKLPKCYFEEVDFKDLPIFK